MQQFLVYDLQSDNLPENIPAVHIFSYFSNSSSADFENFIAGNSGEEL